jgi:hypothetical protein
MLDSMHRTWGSLFLLQGELLPVVGRPVEETASGLPAPSWQYLLRRFSTIRKSIERIQVLET